VTELLDSLVRKGIRMAILSNKPHEFTELMVSKLLSKWQFEIVLGALPGTPKKPDPAVALEIAKRMEIPPAEYLYLGDSDVDMQTATAADMYPAGALWGFRTGEELLHGGAKILIKHPAELLDLL